MLGKIDSGIRDTSASKIQQPKHAAKAASSAPAANSRSAPSIAPASGLPSDRLSSSIISFAKFFSLPLKPQVLADIRRQALALPVLEQNTLQTAKGATAAMQGDTSVRLAAQSIIKATQSVPSATQSVQQAITLCAAALESKGVELAPKGLEAYVDAVDPDSRRQNGQKQDRQKKDKNDNEEAITGDSLKKAAFEYLEKDSLLEILNRLPGKNGQRWIVLPFDFSEGGREYNVSMRILLDSEKISNRAACMAIDISSCVRDQGLSVSDNREIFIFESANDKITRLCVYRNMELPEREHHQYKQEISKHFDVPLKCIFVKTSEDAFPFESGFGNEFPTIDEAV